VLLDDRGLIAPLRPAVAADRRLRSGLEEACLSTKAFGPTVARARDDRRGDRGERGRGGRGRPSRFIFSAGEAHQRMQYCA
jgi:hypothetical protein